MTSSVLLEHRDAIGQLGTQRVPVSILAAIGPALVARGADRILVPVPGSFERERASEGLESLPIERRSLVKLIDSDGEVLKRVREYLLPLRHQATRWPESAFVSFAEAFLYRLALASKHRTAVAHDSVQVLREFIPGLDPTFFTGEARFRLADIMSLICAYRPSVATYPGFARQSDTADVGRTVWQVLRAAEFSAVVAASGKLGYVKEPRLALAVLGEHVRALVSRPVARGLLTASQSAADLAGAGDAAEGLGRIAEFIGNFGSTSYRPPFFDLGSSVLTVYRVALEEAHPGARPPDGSIMAFEEWRAGGTGVTWLSTGEEDKLAREEATAAVSREAGWVRACEAQARFYR
jgi:hypothetical protein